jgi:hypothetical protein
LLILLCAGCWNFDSLGSLYEGDQGTEVNDLGSDLRHNDLHVPGDQSTAD